MTKPIKRERADAARNREAILAAAAALFDREGVESPSVQDIATAAGVGKATVFRRFGDRTALIAAVLEPRAAALRQAVESGPPPLGPGGDTTEALPAFLDALFDFVWRNRPLIRALEDLGPHAYYANDFSQFWIAELSRRLGATAPAPDIDGDYLAHAVFTSLRADVIDYLVTARGMTRGRIRGGVQGLAASVTGWRRRPVSPNACVDRTSTRRKSR